MLRGCWSSAGRPRIIMEERVVPLSSRLVSSLEIIIIIHGGRGGARLTGAVLISLHQKIPTSFGRIAEQTLLVLAQVVDPNLPSGRAAVQ